MPTGFNPQQLFQMNPGGGGAGGAGAPPRPQAAVSAQEQAPWNEFFSIFPQAQEIMSKQALYGPGPVGNILAQFEMWKNNKNARNLQQQAALPGQQQQQQQQSNAAAAVLQQQQNQGRTQAGSRIGATTQSQSATATAAGGSSDPSGMLAKASAGATAGLQQRAVEGKDAAFRKLATQLPFISQPLNIEEKQFLPRARLRSLAAKACGDIGKLTLDAEEGMKLLAAEFSKGAITFAVAAARRRKAQKLDPGDVALYMKQTWGVDLPGFKKAEVTPYRRLVGSDVHKARLAAVRRSNVAPTRQVAGGAVGGGGGAGPSGGVVKARERGSSGRGRGRGGGRGSRGGKRTAAVVAVGGGGGGAAASRRGEEDDGSDDDDGDEDMPDF